MADERGWPGDVLRLVQIVPAIEARLARAERDIEAHERELIASDAVAGREHKEMRDEYLAGLLRLETKLDGLKLWAISILVALCLNLLIFIVGNITKILAK